ncbi:MAG: hypothetical protein Q4F18_08795 [Clostridia bacterium]|nr:hypothetical protein [Clostridia bacterium]
MNFGFFTIKAVKSLKESDHLLFMPPSFASKSAAKRGRMSDTILKKERAVRAKRRRFGTGACRRPWQKQAGEASESEKERLRDNFVFRAGSPMFPAIKSLQSKNRGGAEGINAILSTTF